MNIKELKIIVTGGSGFLGKHVVSCLKERGCQNIFIPRSRDYDLRKESDIINMFKDFKTDIVIHLAAVVGGIGANQKKPATFFYDNLIMGVQLMEQARRFGVKKFVTVGTVCSYPRLAPVPFQEKDLWNGYPEETNAPYGIAKKALLVQAQSYRKQFGFNSIFLIPVNLYGPWDNFDLETSHVIPAIIRKCLDAKELGSEHIVLWGSGHATREFLYVKDAACAIVLATELYDEGLPVNIGTGKEISIKALAHLIKELTEFEGDILWDETKPDGQPRRKLDIRLAKEKFGFSAKTDLKTGLQQTIEWYRKHRDFTNQ
ncbi:GDP-fucose synthetase [Bacillaceae bacterium ZC4]|jgi:GDP-L-fucose synthase|uniref:GDP-L-fucose synthase family protein n=1 Tax=Aeribacillus TaxID=1055323 RepID=UPI0011898DBB|nr:GDP-fucose synthetase [Bacillaceae bacterium ZC4]MDR9792528.1 GDP-L-fucose synthase [Aeribacillus pallidus]MED1437617.1 GDP-L-fucose synthase [Aeribacillus composti]